VINALLALGYNDKEAQFAVKNLESSVSVTEGIRQALKVLSKA
jgi:Holliday junction DNA helicase RuvA